MSVILWGGGKTGGDDIGLDPAMTLESLECRRDVNDRRIARRELSSLSLSLGEATEARSEMLCDVELSLRGNM